MLSHRGANGLCGQDSALLSSCWLGFQHAFFHLSLCTSTSEASRLVAEAASAEASTSEAPHFQLPLRRKRHALLQRLPSSQCLRWVLEAFVQSQTLEAAMHAPLVQLFKGRIYDTLLWRVNERPVRLPMLHRIVRAGLAGQQCQSCSRRGV